MAKCFSHYLYIIGLRNMVYHQEHVYVTNINDARIQKFDGTVLFLAHGN